jgi:hypothetical protein
VETDIYLQSLFLFLQSTAVRHPLLDRRRRPQPRSRRTSKCTPCSPILVSSVPESLTMSRARQRRRRSSIVVPKCRSLQSRLPSLRPPRPFRATRSLLLRHPLSRGRSSSVHHQVGVLGHDTPRSPLWTSSLLCTPHFRSRPASQSGTGLAREAALSVGSSKRSSGAAISMVGGRRACSHLRRREDNTPPRSFCRLRLPHFIRAHDHDALMGQFFIHLSSSSCFLICGNCADRDYWISGVYHSMYLSMLSSP